jgi:hypothetical protein
VALLVRCGADLDAPTIGTGHTETALHLAASNDDVRLIDALVDAEADIERPGSSIAGGPAPGRPDPEGPSGVSFELRRVPRATRQAQALE